jgi:hypothetical protein
VSREIEKTKAPQKQSFVHRLKGHALRRRSPGD